ncbi:AAA family ATPase [Pseudomonas sivasensis]|uniref:AAA family ATPase n=1 Tax=Pseudomonas sivasensis TaxID=1880678 RepID=UPI003B9FDE84
MSLVDDLLLWSAELKDWQRDALRRLFTQDTLSPADLEGLAGMVKEAHGNGLPSPERASPLTQDHVAGVGSGATVQLLGLSNLSNINGFPAGRGFDLQPNGLTVLFGENGVGKSGYARLLKNTCRARRRDNVRCNAFGAAGVPAADVSFLVDGERHQTTWTQGEPSNSDLSMISVYDAACAMDYVEEEGTPVFLPYGLGQMNRLVLAQRELHRIITAERDAVILNAGLFDLLRGETEVGALIKALGVGTDVEVMRAIAVLSERDEARLGGLIQALQDMNPEPKAQALDRQSERLEVGATHASSAYVLVSDEALQTLRRLYDENIDADAAYQAAQKNLREVDDATLPGTGNGLWKLLYEAAERFSSADAYPDHAFPHTEDGAKCVLCQTVLNPDAQKRMRDFSTFVNEHAAANATAAANALRTALAVLNNANFTPLDAPSLVELLARAPDEHANLTAACEAWQLRRAWLTSAIETNDWTQAIPAFPDGDRPEVRLRRLIEANKLAAETLRESDDPDSRARLQEELNQLKARQAFAVLLPQAEQYVHNSLVRQNLDKCLAALSPTGVSTKMTNLARQYVTSALADAMTTELRLLGYRRDIQPELAGRTSAGMTKVTLKIRGSNLDAHHLLSEGEQRAIALALFLAEIRSLPHQSTVIFDDPSTSLDHRYRRKMAERLASLAIERQVIVLTHDAVFLTELNTAQRKAGVEASYKSVRWDNAPGQIVDGLTWETMNCKMRLEDIARTAKEIQEAMGTYMNDDCAQAVTRAYGKLRGTIERAVREEFMNNTVQPFSDVVSVESFGAVIGHPQAEWETLIDIYDRSCEAIEAHDTPAERQLPIPPPEQLLSDVQVAVEMIGEAAKRRKAYERVRSDRNAARKKPFQAA